MIFSIKIDGAQRNVTVNELGDLLDRRVFTPTDFLIGPGLSQWVSGVEAGEYLHDIYRERLPAEFGTFISGHLKPDPDAPARRLARLRAAKIALLVVVTFLAGAALFLLLLYLFLAELLRGAPGTA